MFFYVGRCISGFREYYDFCNFSMAYSYTFGPALEKQVLTLCLLFLLTKPFSPSRYEYILSSINGWDQLATYIYIIWKVSSLRKQCKRPHKKILRFGQVKSILIPYIETLKIRLDSACDVIWLHVFFIKNAYKHRLS